MIIKDFPHILHGGDYNPDQWLREPEKIEDDFRLMDEAGCNVFSIGIFSWSQYEPEEGAFDFAWLDMIMDRCHAHGKKVFLATPSASRPAWLGNNYPETCRIDRNGRREPWGWRANSCWTSPVMREKTGIIIDRLAERYAKHPALAGWHIGNEYHGECFCPLCLEKYAEFLRRRYGSIENFNAANWTEFWGHKATKWLDIDPRDLCMDGAAPDWMRFTTERICDFMKFEIDHVRKFSELPVTTNMMSCFPTVDYWKIAELCDFVCDDTYPLWSRPDVEHEAAKYAMAHDMHYTMQHKPFMLMESCPGVPNYYFPGSMRRDNELEREMLLALGRGADGTLYFQWRAGRGNAEKIHGAVVGHDGGNQTRIFKSVADYGRRIAGIAEIVDSRTTPEIAVIFDWETLWCLDATKGFGKWENQQRYTETVTRNYQALWSSNYPLAVIDQDRELAPYKMVIAPMLFMLKPGMAERLKRFVEAGGTLVITYLSGYVDEFNRCFEGGFPGAGLREFFGVWNEDIDLFGGEMKQKLVLSGGELAGKREFPVLNRAAFLHAEGAEVLAAYGEDFMAGTPAITSMRRGKGRAVYLGCETGQEFLKAFYSRLAADCGVEPVMTGVPDCVKVSRRNRKDADYYFLLNMSHGAVEVPLPEVMDDVWQGAAGVKTAQLKPRGGTVLRSRK